MKPYLAKVNIEINRIVYRSIPLDTHIEKHRNSSSLIFYVQGGHKFHFGNHQIEAREGELVYLPYGSAYTNHTISPKTEYYQFDFNDIKNNERCPIWDQARVLNQKDALKYLPIFRSIYEMYSAHDDAYDLFCVSGILKIIGMIYQDDKYNKESGYGVKKIEKTVNHLNEFYYLDTSVEDLAKISSISVSNLEKSFKTYFSAPPLAYRNKIRIENAKLFLAGGYSVAETAAKVGFSDVYYFSRVFHKICGTTPGRYAKENKMI